MVENCTLSSALPIDSLSAGLLAHYNGVVERSEEEQLHERRGMAPESGSQQNPER